MNTYERAKAFGESLIHDDLLFADQKREAGELLKGLAVDCELRVQLHRRDQNTIRKLNRNIRKLRAKVRALKG